MSVQVLVDALRNTGKTQFTRPEINEVAKQINVNPSKFLSNPQNKIQRGLYGIDMAPKVDTCEYSNLPAPTAYQPTTILLAQPKLKVEVDNLVPNKDATYVPFGFHKDLNTILSSKQFYPVFITGLSGNGKTTMVEQVCAALKRECIRVNISIETDEDDLIGGNTLVDGNVVYREGPVTIAMKRGAVLILDECDRGSNKLMCLQAILEGKPYFNKKTGETIYPAPGFNIVELDILKCFNLICVRCMKTEIDENYLLYQDDNVFNCRICSHVNLFEYIKGAEFEIDLYLDFIDQNIVFIDNFFDGVYSIVSRYRIKEIILMFYKKLAEFLKYLNIYFNCYDLSSTAYNIYVKLCDEIQSFISSNNEIRQSDFPFFYRN